jgi:phage terminase large subunit-like protein
MGPPKHVRQNSADWRQVATHRAHCLVICTPGVRRTGARVYLGVSLKKLDYAAGILQVHPKDFRPLHEPSKRRLTWPNGAVASIYNATEPEQLRGPEHAAAWCDELCKWQYQQETWDQLAFGLHAGAHPQICITTTPRPTRLLKAIVADPRTVVTRGSTFDNRSNLASSFLEALERKYAGTRLGRQEIEAEILEDVQGALWSRPTIDAARLNAYGSARITCQRSADHAEFTGWVLL